MKALLSSVALVAIPLSGLMAPPASAQLAVYDPANHAQNILQAVRALQEIDNQVRQLTHEIDMIEKMARDLETLPVEVARAIIADRIRRIGELIGLDRVSGARTGACSRPHCCDLRNAVLDAHSRIRCRCPPCGQ